MVGFWFKSHKSGCWAREADGRVVVARVYPDFSAGLGRHRWQARVDGVEQWVGGLADSHLHAQLLADIALHKALVQFRGSSESAIWAREEDASVLRSGCDCILGIVRPRAIGENTESVQYEHVWVAFTGDGTLVGDGIAPDIADAKDQVHKARVRFMAQHLKRASEEVRAGLAEKVRRLDTLLGEDT